MNGIEVLRSASTPIDKLIRQITLCGCKELYKPHKFPPFTSYVTLEVVNKYSDQAKQHIYQLLAQKEKYGFLYNLNSRRLVVPLTVSFNGDLVIDPEYYIEIVDRIDGLARDFHCPGSQTYEITRLELLYFFTLLVNPQLNWITLDYLLKGNRCHAYLVASPDRIGKA
ncbi:hypothetical protein RF55_19442 [Lasius niger]|uniref:Uncharacterized protein n=1 Tax=Lasius niger TaxID=67767 RepID=A0A0J7K0I0_LASNI|nr:hypothetical protein RF55_19442 [Lasius niger]